MTWAPENGFVEERREVDMQLQGSVKMSDNGLVEESMWIRDFFPQQSDHFTAANQRSYLALVEKHFFLFFFF